MRDNLVISVRVTKFVKNELVAVVYNVGQCFFDFEYFLRMRNLTVRATRDGKNWGLSENLGGGMKKGLNGKEREREGDYENTTCLQKCVINN